MFRDCSFLISVSFAASGRLVFVIVEFYGYLLLYLNWYELPGAPPDITLGGYFACLKGRAFCDFLFAFQHTKFLSKKRPICSFRGQILSI